MAKSLTAAKQLRDKFWAEFKSACVDLEEELGVVVQWRSDVKAHALWILYVKVCEVYGSSLHEAESQDDSGAQRVDDLGSGDHEHEGNSCSDRSLVLV